MRIGLVVDSACDLPKSFIDDNNIIVLPTVIRLGDELYFDHRDPEATLNFYQNYIGEKTHHAETAPCPVDTIKEIFLRDVVLKCDFAICETVSRSRSPTFEHATKASFAILAGYKAVRRRHCMEEPFSLRVINSKNVFTGQGVLAAETIRMIKARVQVNEIRQRVEDLSQNVYAYLVPTDLFYLRARAKAKGDKSVSWLSASLGTALDIKPVLRAYREETAPVARFRGFDTACEKLFAYVSRQIRQGLLSPYVVVGYGGDPAMIEQAPGFAGLRAAAKAKGVEVLVCMMGLSAGVNLGAGGISVAFAAQAHEPVWD